MPRPSGVRPFAILGILLLIVIGILFGGVISSLISGPAAPILSWMHSASGSVRGIFVRMGERAQSNETNAQLRERNAFLESQLSQSDALREEMVSLQSALGVRERFGREPIAGSVYSFLSVGDVQRVMVNRGSDDSVVVGDVVVRASGSFIGIIAEVYPRHAVARTIRDASVEVVANIVGTETNGLVHVGAGGVPVLDLIRKDEPVIEGQYIATSGDDRIPPGFIIGTVQSVDNESATLFKIVRVRPQFSDIIIGPVLILRP